MTTTLTAAAPAPDAVPPSAEPKPTEASHVSALDIRGCRLTDEETAAVVAVIAQLAATEPVANDTGGTGPTNRADQRSHRLQVHQRGIWGRPGPSTWQFAGGLQ